MTMLPFRGRCHTCGHDHDAEDRRVRDTLDIINSATEVMALAGRRSAENALRELVALKAISDKYARLVPDSPRATEWKQYLADVYRFDERWAAAWEKAASLVLEAADKDASEAR